MRMRKFESLVESLRGSELDVFVGAGPESWLDSVSESCCSD